MTRSGPRRRVVLAFVFTVVACADSTSPAAGPQLFRATAISAGWNHTCALDLEGSAWCWGYDRYGELGVDLAGTMPVRPGAAPISYWPIRVSGGMHFVSIASGDDFSCALTAQGAAYCWGINKGFRLGLTPPPSGCAGACSYLPVPVSGGHAFTKVWTAEIACGLEAAGALYCWGGGAAVGLLGPTAPNYDSSATPIRIVAEDGSNPAWENMSSQYGSACASTTDQRVACWGGNQFAALGIGDTLPIFVGQPRFVATTTPLHGAATFDLGGCALDEGGHAYCWGDNRSGLLGTGTTRHQSCRASNVDCSWAPVAAASTVAFMSLAGGTDTMCGLTADGAAYCWGNVLAVTTNVQVTTPIALATPVHFRALSLGGFHLCGVGTDSVAYCWGLNDLGEVGPMFGSMLVSTPTAVRRP
jgi:alpha-tubulin suppressor-like RCC1 family protein